MTDEVNERKLEHIRVIGSDPEVERHGRYFDEIRLKHRALPEIALNDVDPSTTFVGKKLSFPLLISSMTGGSHDVTRNINRHLARAAEATGVALGVGSQRVMFRHPEARSSFELRQYAPNALLFSNLGAVQLNYGFDVESCREALDVLDGDALYLHLNPLQEAVQREGDTDFSGLADKIGELASQLERPIILKEVGAGMSAEDVELMLSRGVRHFDVAGTGGTSWSRIEHQRLPEEEQDGLGLLFQDWGIPTPEALRALQPYRDRATLVASGGVRTGMDMVKCMILGASLCGIAAPFLEPAMKSSELVVDLIMRLKRQFVTTMFLLGMSSLDQLQGNESLLR